MSTRVGDIQYIRPSKGRDADARAYAALLGHVLGPWTKERGGMRCYYAVAACVQCGAAFCIYSVRGSAGYDGWAAHETCEQTRRGRSSDGTPSIWGRARIPGPEPRERAEVVG